jgi:hypothetical protein
LIDWLIDWLIDRLIDWLIDWLIDHIMLYLLIMKFPLIWRSHFCRWRVAKFIPMLGTLGLWTGRDHYHTTLSVTRGRSFSGLIRRTFPFSLLLRNSRGCWGPLRVPIQLLLTTLSRMLKTNSYPDPQGCHKKVDISNKSHDSKQLGLLLEGVLQTGHTHSGLNIMLNHFYHCWN